MPPNRRRERFITQPRLARIPRMTHDSRFAPDAPSTDQDALDRLRRFGGDKLLGEMITLFLAAAPERLEAARAAATSGDAESAERALHSLKSSAAQLGAMRMQRLSELGEHAAKSVLLDQVLPIIDELSHEHRRVHAWLTAARDGGAP